MGEEIKVDKYNYKLNKFVVDDSQVTEDAVKIEKLVTGYGKKAVILKHSSTSGFSDSGMLIEYIQNTTEIKFVIDLSSFIANCVLFIC